MWSTALATLIGLIVEGAIIQTSLRRGVMVGLAVGVALAFVVNATAKTPVPCLQQSKGWDILWAYKLC